MPLTLIVANEKTTIMAAIHFDGIDLIWGLKQWISLLPINGCSNTRGRKQWGREELLRPSWNVLLFAGLTLSSIFFHFKLLIKSTRKTTTHFSAKLQLYSRQYIENSFQLRNLFFGIQSQVDNVLHYHPIF